MDTKIDKNELYEALLSLNTVEECAKFIEDLMTINEINSCTQRLKVAKLIYTGTTCNAAAKLTGASTATVSRVNKCLQYGPGGYKTVLDRIIDKEEK